MLVKVAYYASSIAFFWPNYAKIMLFFANYATVFLNYALWKIANKSKKYIFHWSTRKKRNKYHNEIEINMFSFGSGMADAIL